MASGTGYGLCEAFIRRLRSPEGRCADKKTKRQQNFLQSSMYDFSFLRVGRRSLFSEFLTYLLMFFCFDGSDSKNSLLKRRQRNLTSTLRKVKHCSIF